MAKFRFPGKALKLNYRKRVRFRYENEIDEEDPRVLQIKEGFLLFRQLFGESDEDDEFEGFTLHESAGIPPERREKNGCARQRFTKNTKRIVKVESLVDERGEKEENFPPKTNESSLILAGNGSEQSFPFQEETVINEENDEAEVQVLVEEKIEVEEKSCETLAKKTKKVPVKENICVISDRTSKKFVLPTVSVRSSRIIKPNKRLFDDFTPFCSTQAADEICKNIPPEIEISSPKPVRARNNDQDPDRLSPDQNEKESDPVCRSITFYTNSITEQFKGHVGRPPKKPSHRGEGQPKEEFSTPSSSSSPVRAPKEVKVKEKIEKLLRSPWDNRLKQNSSKVCGKDKEKGSLFTANNSLVSKSILRKARLNLNKQTLQKIRSPASVQRLVPLSEEDTAERKCGLCQNCSHNTVCRYGVSCCEVCHISINSFTEGLSSNLECCGGQGECQLVGLSIDERCEACWLCRILLTCAMPSLLHDRLRKQLPTTLREKVPTSLGRSFNVKAIILPEGDFNEADGSKIFTVDSSSGGFGSHVDLPGGWKRKTGSEVVVISPSGEKFRSVSKLDEYLKRLGINAEASVLFGSLTNKNTQNTESKSLPKLSMKSNKVNNVVVTTLPGGWTRRIKWRSTGDRFDTYVCSPDGRTFRSCRELSAYFHRIGKVDDIHKYFPVRNASTSRANSSENSETSSTEPASSSEACSEESFEDKSPSASDSESDECNFRLNTPVRNSVVESVVRNSDEKGIKKLMSNLKKKLENDADNLKLKKMKMKTKSEMENRKAEPKIEKGKVKPEIENKQAKSEIENMQAKLERENRKEKSEFWKRKAKPEKESRNVELESHNWDTEPVMENMKSTREMENRKANQEIENRMTNPEIEKWKITNEIKDGKRKPENENRKTKPGIENWKEKMRIGNRNTEYKNANDCGKLESDDSIDSDYESKVNKLEIKQGKTLHSSGRGGVSQSKKNAHLPSVIIKNLDNKIHPKKKKSSFNDKQDLTVVFQAGKKETSQKVDNFNKGINRNIIDLKSYEKAQIAANESGLNECVNVDKFLHSNVESDEALDKGESSLDEGQKFVLQIKKHGYESPGNDNGIDPIRKHRKRKKKKKRKHEKHLKEKIVKSSSQSLLICDIDKIVANLNECKEDLNKSSETRSPAVKSLASSFFADTSYLSSDIPCHPNDTWQTLISNSFLEMKDSIDLCDESIPDITNNTEREELDVPGETELNQNKISTEPSIVVFPTKIIIPVQLKDKSQKKVKKQSPFTTEHFANGWSRKIKWNDKGCGKVSFLTSPDGQKIVSSIELLAYFKKAGKPVLNISYYFPKDLVRDIPQIEEVNTENETAREDPQARLTPAITDQGNNGGKLLKGKKILSRPPKKLSRRALKLLKVPGRKMSMRAKLSLDESNQLLSDGGPRVKHVCRSQAQVLGMPRAVFPSPDKEEKPKVKTVLNSSLTMAPTSFISPGKEDKTKGKKVLHSSGKKAKFLTVATPTGRKILKKTLWCNKCSGCTTPNCRKCSNCKDMKKYGGPGTKKKPCVMRKCHNPFKAIKASSTEETFAEEKEKVTVGGKASASQTSCESIVLSSLPLSAIDGDSESDVKADLTADSADDLRKDIVSEEEYLPSIEKSIFIPKLMRHSYEVKDRGDVQAGKECNPGARVNIDYWQGYEAEEMLISGFPIITSVPLQYDSLCFRCGSAGMEQLLYCIWCCEGVHPFCLEEGEGPDSDEQEALWVCRKCAVCHVCGGPGHDNLLQCSGCRKHYHLECLGPSSHVACQAPAESSWVKDALRLISHSWPKQTPIFDVGDSPVKEEIGKGNILLYEDLENLSDFEANIDEDKTEETFLPCSVVKPINSTWQLSDVTSTPEKKKLALVQSVCIEDTFENLEEDGEHICLEEEFGALEEIIPKEEEIIQFIRNIDLLSSPAEKHYVGMEEDEYLCLKYSKILPFSQSSIEFSLHRVLQIIHKEMFSYLEYPLWSELFAKGLVKEKSWKNSDISADTESTNLVNPVSSSPIDLKCMMEVRRKEAQQDIKNREELRIQEERRQREMERERLRRKRLMECQNENSKINRKNLKSFSWHKKNNERRNSVVSLPSKEDKGATDILSITTNQAFVEYESDQNSTKVNGSLWQPQSWEEFDALVTCSTKKESSLSHAISKSRKLDKNSRSPEMSQLNLKWLAEKKKLRKIKDEKCKRKQSLPFKYGSPSKIKSKKFKMSKCSVKITRLKLRKSKRSPLKHFSKKSSLRKVSPSGSSPESLIDSAGLSPNPSVASTGSSHKTFADFSSKPTIECLPIETDFESASESKFESMNGNIEKEEQMHINEYDHELDKPLVDQFSIEVNSHNIFTNLAHSTIELVSCDQKISLKVAKYSTFPVVPEEVEQSDVESISAEENESSKLKNVKNKRKSQDNIESNSRNMSKRPRRSSYGRASELASMRKAMMDL